MTATIRHLDVSAQEHQALTRLRGIAARDTGQSRCVAEFLLSWWNAQSCGGFDLTMLWGLDDALIEDVVTVFKLVARCQHYPDALGYAAGFDRVVRAWRPDLK